MKRFAQILYDKAHWIFEDEEMPHFPPDPEGNPIIIIDITDHLEVQEGWDYDHETDTFTKPIIPEPEPQPEIIEEPDITELIFIENQYQTALLELQMLGGEF